MYQYPRLAAAAIAFVWSVPASAAPVDFTNEATRQILLETEDTSCTNVYTSSCIAAGEPAACCTGAGTGTCDSEPQPRAGDPGCLVFANDPAAIFTDTSDDFQAKLEKTANPDEWRITVDAATWQVVVAAAVSAAGANLLSNTENIVLFNTATGEVYPDNAPAYWSADASFGLLSLILTGNPNASDRSFFGAGSNPTGGPPVLLNCSCAVAKADQLTPSLLGPDYPGLDICVEPFVPQPGFVSGPGATLLTAFTATAIRADVGGGQLTAATTPVFAPLDWNLQEVPEPGAAGSAVAVLGALGALAHRVRRSGAPAAGSRTLLASALSTRVSKALGAAE